MQIYNSSPTKKNLLKTLILLLASSPTQRQCIFIVLWCASKLGFKGVPTHFSFLRQYFSMPEVCHILSNTSITENIGLIWLSFFPPFSYFSIPKNPEYHFWLESWKKKLALRVWKHQILMKISKLNKTFPISSYGFE